MKKNNLFINILPKSQQQLFQQFVKCDFLEKFYLAGGTGLALQIGHRISVDFDFFSKENIQIEELKNNILKLGKIEIFQEKKIHCIAVLMMFKFRLLVINIIYFKKKTVYKIFIIIFLNNKR